MKANDFIELQIEVCEIREAEIVGADRAQRDLVRCMILPTEIAMYRDEVTTDEDQTDRTVITMKSGQEIVAVMKITEFEQLIFTE